MKEKGRVSILSIILTLLIFVVVGFIVYGLIFTDFFGLISRNEDSITIGGLINSFIPASTSADTEIENVSAHEPIILDNNKEGNTTSNTAQNRYYYNQLDTYGKIIYEGFEDNKENMKSGTYVIDFGTEFNDLLNSENGEETLNVAFQSAWNAYTYDNMDLFYIDVEKLTLITRTRTIGNNSTHTVELSNGDNSSYLKSNFSTREEIDSTLNLLEAMRSEIEKQIEQYDDVEKMRQVHNWLINTVEYDIDFESEEPYSIVGALIENKAVCEGYARAYKYIMDGLGIPCILVSGAGTNSNGETESHAWNYIQINNAWYAIDTTWDDPVAIGNAYISEEDRYENFLRGSDAFYRNHHEDGYLSPGSIEFTFPELSTEDYPYNS